MFKYFLLMSNIVKEEPKNRDDKNKVKKNFFLRKFIKFIL